MELKEYLQIVKRNGKVFFGVIFSVCLIVFLYYSFRPISYSASLTIDVSRIGLQQTSDYRFDDFYRLQADEKFCETIVEWLNSPRVIENIYQEAKIDTSNFSLEGLSKSIKAEKRSSQIVAVNFSAPSEKIAKNIATSVSKIISKKTKDLNISQKENTWFQIFSEEPVVKENKINFLIILATFLFAIFIAFWAVLIKHYLE